MPTTHELWPPLSLIRSSFVRADAALVASGGGMGLVSGPHVDATVAAAEPEVDESQLLMPLTELARRREAVAQRAFPARWAPGRLLSVLHEGRLLGVLLDKCVQGDVWQGWMAASEADWAGAFDVLLEPQDEPFEPMFGLIQTWNALNLTQTPQLCARVLGELSATRLAAIRAVHDEWKAQVPLAIAPQPGLIALRNAGGVFSVLSGTPLGNQDPRADYQALYREAALPLAAAIAGADSPVPPTDAKALAAPGTWERVRGWFAADRLVRPAFAVLALVVVVQNAGLLRSNDEEEVRFRSPPTVSGTLAPELLVRWKPGVRIEDTGPLLESIDALLVGAPDAQGRWHVRLADPVGGLGLLSASPLVESVSPP